MGVENNNSLENKVRQYIAKNPIPSIEEVVEGVGDPDAVAVLRQMWTQKRLGLAIDRRLPEETPAEVRYRVFNPAKTRDLVLEGKVSRRETGSINHFPTDSNQDIIALAEDAGVLSEREARLAKLFYPRG